MDRPPLDLADLERSLGARSGSCGPLELLSQDASATRWHDVVSDGTAQYVVRRPRDQAAAVALAAEDRLLGHLSETAIPVPTPVLSSEDQGGQLSVIRHVDGLRVRDRLPAELPRTSTTRHDLSAGLVDVLVRIHSVTCADVGLNAADAEPLDGTLNGWRQRGSASVVATVVDELGERLALAMPPDAPVGLLHNAFSFHALIFDAVDPRRVEAVIGWERAAAGNPLLDLGLLLALWAEDRDEAVTTWLPQTGLTTDDGFFSRSTVTHEYTQRSRLDLRQLEWYVALGYLRLAVLAGEDGRPDALAAAPGLVDMALNRADHSGIAGLARR